MPRWPIRVKLFAGLGLVIGMMLTLMGGSIYGLHAFQSSYLTLSDQLPELRASTDLLQMVDRLEIPEEKDDSPEARRALAEEVVRARDALKKYFEVLKKNTRTGNRSDQGLGELNLAFQMDYDTSALLRELDPDADSRTQFPGTASQMARQAGIDAKTSPTLAARLNRLRQHANELPKNLYSSYWRYLETTKQKFKSSRIIVWSSALAVLAMLFALAKLFHRWVLHPVRLLQRGVRRVARGSFDYRIQINTGDEMQALAETFNDMTAQLGASLSELEQQVQERSRQLVRSERLAGVGFLAAGVAHEINNPLASIAFCSEALENRLVAILDASPTADAKVVRQYLRMIQEEAFRCKRITEKLLDFSRCNDIQRERTDLVGLVQSVVEMIRHMGKYRGKQIVFQPREAVFAHADGQEIKQVVLNLVVNALDCMEPGTNLRIEVRHSGMMAEMSFADEGCGMAPDVLENIFEPFFTRRKVGKGTGLGLSITHRIINQHHGEITATSPGEGLGSTFTVRLPVRPSEDATAPQAPPKGQRAA